MPSPPLRGASGTVFAGTRPFGTSVRVSSSPSWAWAGLVVLLMAATWATVRLVGGAGQFATLWFFLPVLLAAIRFRPGWAGFVGVAAAVLAGPLSPVDIRDGSSQSVDLMLSRGVFLVGIGVLLSLVYRRRAAAVEASIRESEERYRSLVELSPDGILIHVDGRIVFANMAAANMLGAREPERIIGMRVLDVIHPDDHEVVRRRMADEDRGLPVGLVEERFVRLDGSLVDVEVAGIPTVFEGHRAAQVVIRDVSERKWAERALLESEQRFRALIENGSEAITLVGRDGLVVYVSPSAERLLGRTRSEVLGADVWSFLDPGDVEDGQGMLGRVLETAGAMETSEFRIRRPDGGTRWVEAVSHNLVDTPGVGAVVVNARDVTERREAEAQLRTALERLRVADEARRRLLSRLITSQEAERRRISGDIHDDTIQAITAVGIRLDILSLAHPQLGEEEGFQKLRRDVSEAVRRLRTLMFELHPYTLGRYGLMAAFQEYVSEQAKRGDWPECSLEGGVTREPSIEARTVIYRIAQEALTNVRKHARASRVEVRVSEVDGGILVRVEDDGVGFAPSPRAESPTGHLGLSAMRERAEMAGGWCRVGTAHGRGSVIEFWVPDVGPGPAVAPAVAPAVGRLSEAVSEAEASEASSARRVPTTRS